MIATHIPYELTQTQVMVALTGHGGDEAFAGHLRPEPPARLLERHRTATADRSPGIWLLLVLESCLRQESKW